MKFTKQQEQLIKLLKKESLSLGHDFDHLINVASYAANLSQIYKARKEIVIPAALTHDLGRSNLKLRGKDTAVEGAKLAQPILKEAGYNEVDSKLIIQCIAEHDQPDFHSKLLESKILKDADFLDGFGARGILRSLVYAGETGGGIKEGLERIKIKARKRIDGLEFIESRRLAWQQYRLMEFFGAQIGQTLDFDTVSYSGKLIVLEGISGSGKDTQAEMLQKFFQAQKQEALIVNHPTQFLKDIWKQWRSQAQDLRSEVYLMLADRVRMINSQIIPALKKGGVVISTRSSVDAQVYQYDQKTPGAWYRFLFSFEPIPEKIFYLNISADQAWQRSEKKLAAGTEKEKGFFDQKQKNQLKRFEKVLKFFPNVVRINGSQSKQEVFREIISNL